MVFEENPGYLCLLEFRMLDRAVLESWSLLGKEQEL